MREAIGRFIGATTIGLTMGALPVALAVALKAAF